jgi:pimeloyl-ACP methyl ester carboxylesterase
MPPQRHRSSDGVEVALHDLGGRPHGVRLLFVHATGFCGPVFRPLAAVLGKRFRCWAVDLRGHGLSLTPEAVDYDWSGFADDVLAAVDGLGGGSATGRPLIALGHSSGGAAVLLAEAERPGTFGSLWCYEPIVWPQPEVARDRAEWLAAGAAKRRDTFPSAEEAYENFRSKPPMSALAPDALRAYVEGGFERRPDGSVTLRCRPESEAAVYRRAVEGDRFPRLAEVACPVVVAAGGRSDAITPVRARAQVDALPAGRLRVFDDLGHFGPLEDPAAVAASVLADLA